MTSLTLSSNDHDRVPLAVAMLATPRMLDLCGNVRLALEPGDLTVLAALPALEGLYLTRRGVGPQELEEPQWSQANAAVLEAIKARSPHLELVGACERDTTQ